MDPPSPRDSAESDEHVLALVDEFLERREAGEKLTPERFVAEHPEAAEELQPYLAGLSLIDKACSLGSANAVGETPFGEAKLPAIEGFELVEEIGRGGMGVVYKALQVSTKRFVALKVMLAGPFASASARRRFEREVELAARLKHPNIVSVLESGDVAGQRYYAMDYVAGVRLDRHLSASQSDIHTTLKLFVQICQAVEYAHSHGVVHRDLKPGNVLIDDEGNPHVLDFGLAKATDQADTEESLTTHVSLPGQVLGTLSYLSPEQAAGTPGEVDRRTDVYALGVTLFEALTDSLPFDTTGRPSQVIQRILEAPPARPSSLSDRVDADLETILLKALEKDKGRRYQSAKELAEDISRYLEGEPILARRPSSLYVLSKKLRKHRLAVAIGSVTVALILIGLATGSWWREHTRERELAQARRVALRIQHGLESQIPSQQLGHAQGLIERHAELPEAQLVWAQTLHRNEQQYAAIAFLEHVLKDAPSRWACRGLLAECCRAAGDAERADAEQARAERDAPDTAEAWYLRSLATLEPAHALHCAEQAMQRQPSHVLAQERLTWLRLHTGDLKGALQGADKLIELGENAHQWTIFKGLVLIRQGRFREAIEAYSRVNAYIHLAHAYRRIKEYEKAVECYTALIGPKGETTANVWHFYQRATPLWILGRTEEALEDYRRVRIMLGQPYYSDARQYIILRESDRQDEAERVLSDALDAVKKPWLRRVFKCLIGQLTPEQLVDSPATQNKPEKLCEAYYYAGEACLLEGQLAEAREWFEQCVQTGVEFDPDASPETPMNEYELAQWRLDTLSPEESPTSRP